MSTPPLSVKKLTTKRTSADQSGLNLMVVVVLGLVSIVCVIGVIMLALGGKPTPEFLVAIGSAAVGGLVGLLVQTPKDKS
jgi:hypothetical protein